MTQTSSQAAFYQKDDRIFIKPADGSEDKPVRLVWARPISGREAEIAVLDEKKKEILMLPGLMALDPESQRVVREELDRRYLVPKIELIHHTRPMYGSYYWDVTTDRGRRRFAMKDPSRNILWDSADRLVIRDTLGNRWQIDSLARLDPHSRIQVDKVI